MLLRDFLYSWAFIRWKKFFFLVVLVCFYQSTFGFVGFRILGVNDGLSQSSISDIFQDSHGRMWIATADGLNWYDGHQFFVYRSKDLNESSQNSSFIVGSIFEDARGLLWMGTQSGLSWIDPNEGVLHALNYTAYAPNKAFVHCRVIGMADDQSVLFLTASGELYKVVGIDHQVELVKKFDLHDPGIEGCVSTSGEAVIYFRDHIDRINLETRETRSTNLPTELVGKVVVLKEHKDQLWIGTTNGLWIEDEVGVRRFISHSDADFATINKLNFSRRDQLFVASHTSGVIELNIDLAQLENQFSTSKYSDFPRGEVRAVLYDEMGTLWMAVEGAGICLFDDQRQPFSLYRQGIQEGLNLTTNYIKCLHSVDEDNVWLGTYEGGLAIYNRKTDRTKVASKGQFGNPMRDNTIVDLFRDGEKVMWFSTMEGIYRTDIELNHIERIKVEAQDRTVVCRQLLKVSNGMLIAACEQGIFFYNSILNKFECLENQSSAHSIFEDRDGTIWVGNYYGFLYKMKLSQSNGRDTLLGMDSLLNTYHIRDFAQENEGKNIWLATEKGLVRLDPVTEQWKLFDEESGLINDVIYSLFIDNENRIWATSNRGLIVMDLQSFQLNNYTIDDGLQSMEFNSRAFDRTENGEVFLGGVEGFNSFFPSMIHSSTIVPRPFLTSLRIGPKNQWLNFLMGDEPIVLNYRENTLYFSFSNTDYANASRSQTAFMLVGQNTEWVVTSSFGDIRLEALEPGDYTLKLKARNKDGIWGHETVVAHFVVAPPYWRSWWFILLTIFGVALLSSLIVIYFTRLRFQQKLIKLEQERKIQNLRLQIASDIHDDIGAGLSRIAMMGQLQDKKPSSEFGHEIAQAAKEMTNQLSHIVWSLNPENDEISGIVLYLRQMAYCFFEGSAIEVCFMEEEFESQLSLDPKQRVNLVKGFREVLNNAMKYSKASLVEINISYPNGQMNIQITDNGLGFEKGVVKGGGNGLRILERRMIELNGHFTIQSEIGRGTTVILNFPITT